MKKTLGLRLVAALLLAFALISVLVIAMNYWNARTQLAKQSTAAPLASVLIKSLDALDDAEAATAVLQAFIAELNRVRQEVVPGGGNVSVRLERQGGGTVYESGRDLRNQLFERWPQRPRVATGADKAPDPATIGPALTP